MNSKVDKYIYNDKLKDVLEKAKKYPVVQDFLKAVYNSKNLKMSDKRTKARKDAYKFLEIMNSKASKLAMELEKKLEITLE
jgi:hypothetical protein